MATEAKALDETNFRLAGKRFMLTYKGHVDKLKISAWLDERWPMSFIRCAHETGDEEDPYLHTHIICEVSAKRVDVKNCRAFDFDNVHPHVKKIRTLSHWSNARIYIGKEDPANADLAKEKTPLTQAIWDCNDVTEALMTQVKRPGDACGVLILWDNKPTPKKTKEDMALWPWQKQIVDLVTGPLNDRAIYWIYDPDGQGGKSRVADYLADWRGAYVVTQFAGQYHAATIIQSALASGWDGKLFVCDFPREGNSSDFYGAFECLKNGRITAMKNRGKTLSWCQGNVLALANFAPKPFQWTSDRYHVLELREGTLTKMNYDAKTGKLSRPDDVATS